VKFNDSPVAQEVLHHLPVEGTVSRRGDEIYFGIDVSISAQAQTGEVKVGDVAYWPEGKSICVFFGRTEASTNDKPVPAGPVVIIGSTQASPIELRQIKSGEPIRAFVMGKITDYIQPGSAYDENRKLSQQEIDVLVKRLLTEKESPG